MFPFWVLFAMPVTRDSFFAEAARSQPSDYMTMTLAGRVPQSVWDERYASIVDAAAGLMQRLHESIHMRGKFVRAHKVDVAGHGNRQQYYAYRNGDHQLN